VNYPIRDLVGGRCQCHPAEPVQRQRPGHELDPDRRPDGVFRGEEEEQGVQRIGVLTLRVGERRHAGELVAAPERQPVAAVE